MANEEAALRIMGELAVMCVSDFQSPIYTPGSQVGDCSEGDLSVEKSAAVGECWFVYIDMKGWKIPLKENAL